MFVADKFVFIHLPRTGGTFVLDVIQKFFPSVREIGHHLPLTFLPDNYKNLPVLGTIRNPWDFYVSLYHYVLTNNRQSILAAWMTDYGTNSSFQQSARRLLDFGVNSTRLDALIEMLPEGMDYSIRQIPNLSKIVTHQMRGSGLGYYSSRFLEMFGSADNVFFCRLENLRHDLVRFFDLIGATTDQLCDYILALEKKNSSVHFHYSKYYTPELAELVSAREHPVIQRFGYKFEKQGFQSDGNSPLQTFKRSSGLP